MAKPVNNITAVIEDELLFPTTDQRYPLGFHVDVADDDSNAVVRYTYVRAAAALVAFQPYVLDADGIFVGTADPATNAGKVANLGVPQVAFSINEYGFVITEGLAEVLHIAETYAVGDHLEVLNAGTALVVDGASGSTVKSEKSVGVTVDAGTTAISATVDLYGEQAVIAAV